MKERQKGRSCSLCGDQGFYFKFGLWDIEKEKPELIQESCEWCWTTPDSEFNMKALDIPEYKLQMIREKL